MRLINPFSKCSPIGLDIGACSVKAVQAQRPGRGSAPVACVRFARINKGKPIDTAELANIAAVLRRKGFSGHDIVIVAPADKLKTGPLELPAKGPNVPMDLLARAEFSRLHKADLESSEFAYWETPTAIRAGKTTSLMAVAYPHTDAEQQIALYESAGLYVAAIDTHGSSLVRACEQQLDEGKASAILEIGWGGAVLVLVRNRVVAYERRIADLALSKIHEDLEEEMELSFEEAIEALFDASDRRLPAVTEILSDYFNQLAEQLTKTFSYMRHQYPEAPVERVILAGGGAELPHVATQLEAICGIETRVAEFNAGHGTVGTPGLTSAFGLSRFAA
jgi:type IV pilus assembly protein PilM